MSAGDLGQACRSPGRGLKLHRMTETAIIAARFNGPPQSGNGGYSCGVAAAFVDGPAQVRLQAPPPLDRRLNVVREGNDVRVMDGEAVVAIASPADVSFDAPPVRPSLDDAAAAEIGFIPEDKHIFPTCFVCGPKRSPGDGLRIFAGPLKGSHAVAAHWTPDASLADASGEHVDDVHIWAALDCPSYFAFGRHDLPALLAQLTVQIHRPPRVGEPCVVVAWPTASEGRKHFSQSALLTADGDILAQAKALWIEMRAETQAKVGAAV